MTLIAAFWCAGNQAVLCADSEECYGDFKTSVTKIKPQTIANGLYQVAFGGSGLSDLVDALNDKLERELSAYRERTELALRAYIEKYWWNFITAMLSQHIREILMMPIVMSREWFAFASFQRKVFSCSSFQKQ
jgi:ATP-dependent protease HslVU (ClpYQ) peptidase subunit